MGRLWRKAYCTRGTISKAAPIEIVLKQYLAHSVHFSGGGGQTHYKLCGSCWSVDTFRLCHQGSCQRLTQFQESRVLERAVSQTAGLIQENRTTRVVHYLLVFDFKMSEARSNLKVAPDHLKKMTVMILMGRCYYVSLMVGRMFWEVSRAGVSKLAPGGPVYEEFSSNLPVASIHLSGSF